MRDWITRWESITRNRAKADESATILRTAEGPGKYESLYQYLENRYADTVVLTFSQIEDLLGFSLPDRARTGEEWWVTADPSAPAPPHSDAWVLAGRTAKPNFSARTVVFQRTRSLRRHP